MTPKFPITKDRIRNHFHYFWWQYALLLVFAIFGWNLLYTTTHYRSPEHLKMEWYYQGALTDQTEEKVMALLEQVKPELFPEVEEMSFMSVGMDETYGAMQMMVWMAAGQGDLYLLEKDSYSSYAAEGSMVNLQPYIDSGMLNVEGIDLRKGLATDMDTREMVQCGIPADTLTGLWDLDINPEGKVLCLLVNGGNVDNALELMQYLLDNMRE